MVRLHNKNEIIDFHIDEIPLTMNKLYDTLNKPNICKICGRKAEFIRIAVKDMTKVRAFKICRKCVYETQ